MVTVKCYICSGEGWIVEDSFRLDGRCKCYKCNGTGEIIVSE